MDMFPSFRKLVTFCPPLPNSGYFHKIFGTHLLKGSFYFYSKNVLPLLYFWNYNPPS